MRSRAAVSPALRSLDQIAAFGFFDPLRALLGLVADPPHEHPARSGAVPAPPFLLPPRRFSSWAKLLLHRNPSRAG